MVFLIDSGAVHDRWKYDNFETMSTWRVTFRFAPKNSGLQRSIISVGQVCDRGNIITFRSTGGTIPNEFTGDRIELERAGGVSVDSWYIGKEAIWTR